MIQFPVIRALLFLFFFTLPLNSVQNFRVETEFGLLAIPLFVLMAIIITGIPSLPILYKRARVPFAFALLSVFIFLLASFVDLARAWDETAALSIVIKRFIGVLTCIILIYALNARIVTVEVLLECYSISAAFFLVFVAYMSIIVHGLPYTIPDPLYAQAYTKNQVAVLAVFSFVCALYLCFKALTIVRVTTIVAILIVIFLTYSRAAWLVTLAIFLVMLFYDVRSRHKFGSTRAVISVVGLFFLVWLSSVFLLDKNFVSRAISGIAFWLNRNENTGDFKREALSNLALSEFANSPLVGIGTGNFYAKYPLQTHDSFLQILAENGVLVFIALVSLFVFLAYRLLRLKKTAEVGLGAGLLTYCLVYMGVMNLLEFQLYYIAIALLFVCAQGETKKRAKIGLKKRVRMEWI